MGLSDFLSVQAWLEYLAENYEREPGHVLLELFCFIVIVVLLFRQSYDPKKAGGLSKREQDELIAEWSPEALCPAFTEEQKHFSDRETLIVESGPGEEGKLTIGGKEYLNFASYNFLGLADTDEVKQACKDTITKYGVGSCGPRGFYGSIDTHIKLEEDMAKFVGSEEAIYYSDGLACISSVIPAFSKRGDLIICDEGVNFGIQQGVNLSRSNLLYYKHNDMDDLERILSDIEEKNKKTPGKPLTRRFIIAEGLSEYHGDICPLDKLVQLKNRYKYRVVLDDSLAFGVLGKTGRGSPEHFGISLSEITLYVVTADKALCSVGGLCMGEKDVIDHQRLSGAGYCYSASSPPYVAVAGSVNIKRIGGSEGALDKLRKKAGLLRKKLSTIGGVVMKGDDISPLIQLRLQRRLTNAEDRGFWFKVQDEARAKGVLVDVPCYIPAEKQCPPPSLRVMVSVSHKDADIDMVGAVLSDVISKNLEKHK